jgi:LacI family transcriptional regulator, repressor for deo operon, udp, cdd, tsx, nupC, and nupG
MAARLADIAAHAGVSEATVSRVLNDRPGVSKATRVAVLTALDVLGYQRPERLRTRSAGLVGLITPELENPVFPAFAQRIESQLALQSYTPLLCTQTPGGISEEEYVTTLLEQGVAGIIFVSGLHADTSHHHEQYRDLVSRGLPLVCVNGYAPDIQAPFISVDDHEAMRLAVTHLAQLGHRTIALALGQARYVPAQRKVEGFVRTVASLRLHSEAAAHSWVEHTLFSVEGGHAAASRLLDRGATAIVCGSDLMALGAVRAARQRGLRVPGDVSVVGFDDSTLIAFTRPALTTIRQPVDAMAQASVQALLDAIGGSPLPSTEYVYAPELIVRESTGAAPRAPLAVAVP